MIIHHLTLTTLFVYLHVIRCCSVWTITLLRIISMCDLFVYPNGLSLIVDDYQNVHLSRIPCDYLSLSSFYIFASPVSLSISGSYRWKRWPFISQSIGRKYIIRVWLWHYKNILRAIFFVPIIYRVRFFRLVYGW